jgi:hypothetical protein
MNFGEFEYQVQKMVSELINGMEKAKAEDLGLDPKAGQDIRVCTDAIAVWHSDETMLRYYGRFEYTLSASRKDYGEWIFYTVSDDEEIVGHCIKTFYSNKTK